MLTPAELDRMLISKQKARVDLELNSAQFDWLCKAIGVSPYRISGVTFILKDDLEKMRGNQYLSQARRVRAMVMDESVKDYTPSEILNRT